MSNEDWNELDESYRSALSGALETAHPAVEQAGGDERAAFEAYRDRRNALLESEGHNPGSKWHVTNAHYPTWEASRAALAQPSPAQAEQAEPERPEVVAWQYRVTAGPQTGWSLWHPGKGEEFERSYTVERRPLMTVAQYDRIVGELRAVIAQLRQHKNDYMDSGQETYRALQNEIREREAEIARLDGLVSGRTAERDAANARLHEVATACATAEQERDAALARVAELAQALRHLLHNIKASGKRIDLGLAKECAEDALARIDSTVAAQAQHSGPEEFSFEYRHPNGESHTVTVSRDQVINEMPDFLFEALCSKFCNCEPAGETNVVECCCDEYAEEFKLLAAAPAQAQHSVPEGWMLVPVEPLLNMMSDKDHDTRITAERQLLSILAAAPGKEGV
ncbi:TPA: hypothetical protein SL793_006253 [Pseudomonas aeruginosa]|uniref:hypothetical protein n=1 Tax=Pseudomonas aeruginosa TaxID=287 RepID=UPI0021E27678|nr:hypothetical protein [Pseudomonas aeruginosa]MCV0161006.1 hypothetical protein [Pseudomonas aeruginosa]HEJ1718339.1 hypothetical protein [Pseudomonas aeruginosa]HEJ5404732.1 hypothetical protein [Pseudomonas aeruginosa]HEJ5820788.1 hypothetical protein [Pseudomonas aeruginosa]